MCVKAVSSSLVDTGVSSNSSQMVLNPYDAYALERAIEIAKQFQDNRVICLCMGPPSASHVLTRCIAMGADEAIHLCDNRFAGADTYSTVLTLSKAIERLNYDLIVCGKKSVDGETGQVIGGLAARLQLNCLAGVSELKVCGDKWIVTYTEDTTIHIVETVSPLIISFNDFSLHSMMNLIALKRAKAEAISVWDAKFLGLEATECGYQGSKTLIHNTSSKIRTENKNITFIREGVELFLIEQIKKYK